ncbi:c-type cytochrome biogenesis protein CcmI [Pararhodospirillum photometricum]|uniref:c-type cytochrome biogenesis protein CcmI n=1 Tax=Pararhodospirillum photometricum TaxID=1084 RepID=UPI0002D639CF|nr:c-type cytochrome biogenesis protein CcmI [Pararhodospirillum photometricum]
MTVLFWTVAAGVGLGAAGTLAWPLVRPRRVDADVPTRAAYDLAVYRDQLSEIERDLASGLLPPDQAEAARLEVQRRLLAVPVAPVGPAPEGGIPAPEIPPPQVTTVPAGNRSRAAAAALIIGLPAAALALYTVVGMPGQRDLPFAQRLDEASRLTAAGPEAPASPPPSAPESVDRMASLKAAIAATPEDPEPRLQLARLLLQAGQAAEAVARLPAFSLSSKGALFWTAAGPNGIGSLLG